MVTKFPSGVRGSDLISVLHDHERMIRSNPLVTGLEKISLAGDPSLATDIGYADAQAYRIEEALLFGRIHPTVAFHDTPDGVDCVLHAPLGLVIRIRYRVSSGESDSERSGGGVVLEEISHLRGSTILMPFIRRSFEASHRTTHRLLLEQLSGADNKSEIGEL